MKTKLNALALIASLILITHCGGVTSTSTRCSGPDCGVTPPPPPGSELAKFASTEEFQDYMQEQKDYAEAVMQSQSQGDAADMPTMAPEAEEKSDNQEITNNQERGVDEGGLVKNYRDYLIILREGRIASARIPTPELISNLPIKPDGLDDAVWYDELLVSRNTAVVIGYRWHAFSDYQRGLIELNFFRIAEDGGLSRIKTYFIDSSDYYSWRNYAGRVVNGELILYSPHSALRYDYDTDSLVESGVPSLYQYDGNGTITRIGEMFAPADIYKPIEKITWPVFHSIVHCDLGDASALGCHAQTIIGPWGRELYVTKDAAYLFTVGWEQNRLLYRLAHDASSSGVVRMDLYPIDQFSFAEDSDKATLSVFGISATYSDECYYELDEIPLEDFKPSPDSSEVRDITCLQRPSEYSWWVINRFTQSHLVYATNQYNADQAELTAVNRDTKEMTTVSLDHNVFRLEKAGDKMVTIGEKFWESLNDEDLSWEIHLGVTSLTLSPTLAVDDTYNIEDAFEGEWRSHGYSYKALDGGRGIFGFSMITLPNGLSGYWWRDFQASLLFFEVDEDGALRRASEIKEQEFAKDREACTTSCIDWYGNSRVVFLDDQIYGLIGDQLSGALLDGDAFTVLDDLNIQTGEVLKH